MDTLKGTSISGGIGLGKLQFFYQEEIKINKDHVSSSQIEKEVHKFQEGREKTQKNLESLIKQAEGKFTPENLAVFEGQLVLLEDEELEEEVISLIKEEKCNVLWAVSEIFDQQIQTISSHSDPYLRERAADFRDLRDRFLRIISGKDQGQTSFSEDVILLAKELTPSDTISLDLSHVKGFLSTIGGVTSHAAIISRSLGLPVLVISEKLASSLKEGSFLILDGFKSELYINVSESEKIEYQKAYIKTIQNQERLNLLKDKPCKTKGGNRINLLANIGNPDDAQKALEFSPDGIGLFRSEFLFMGKKEAPSEEVQFQAYSEVIKKYSPRPVTIRTLDIGGDKEISYLEIPKEENPFLGWRAVRMYEEKSSLIKDQLKAILRASTLGLIKIMVPMVINLKEIQLFHKLLEEAKQALKSEGKEFSTKNIKVGIMVETPAAALLANSLSSEVDFFSLGTNDLTQYTLAVDRGNAKVADLFDTLHPAVLKLINLTARVGDSEVVEVSVCGEFASDIRGCLLLVGMGIKNLSMTASLMLPVKDALKKIDLSKLKSLADEALTLSSAEAVVDLIDEFRRLNGII